MLRWWKLAKKDPKALAILESLDKEQLELLPDAEDEPAAFFGAGSQEEYQEMLDEDSGMAAWKKRLKDL